MKREPKTTADLASAISEEAFQAQVIELAEVCGWRVIEFEAYRKAARGKFIGEQRSTGWPDLTLIREIVLFRELKSQAGRTSDEQDEILGALRAAGADVRVWRPCDWPEIERTLGARPAPSRLEAAELVCELVAPLVQPEAGTKSIGLTPLTIAFAAWNMLKRRSQE